jgi:hypothetical protein
LIWGDKGISKEEAKTAVGEYLCKTGRAYHVEYGFSMEERICVYRAISRGMRPKFFIEVDAWDGSIKRHWSQGPR